MRGTGRIRGVVEMENGDPLPRDLTLFFEFANIGSRPARPEPVRVASDGSFLVEDVPAGERTIAAALQSGSDFYVLSATTSGKDLGEGVSIVEDTEGAPVRVQLSTRFARVAGRVASATAEQGGIVVVFAPTESWKQRFRTAYTVVQIAPDGSFSSKVAPGEYLIFARRRDQLPPLITPSFIQTLGARAATVALKADEQQTVDLRLDLP